MSKPRNDRQKDLLFLALDQIIHMGHPLVRLAALIDWKFNKAGKCETIALPRTQV